MKNRKRQSIKCFAECALCISALLLTGCTHMVPGSKHVSTFKVSGSTAIVPVHLNAPFNNIYVSHAYVDTPEQNEIDVDIEVYLENAGSESIFIYVKNLQDEGTADSRKHPKNVYKEKEIKPRKGMKTLIYRGSLSRFGIGFPYPRSIANTDIVMHIQFLTPIPSQMTVQMYGSWGP